MIVTLSGPNDFLRGRAFQKLVADFVTQHTDLSVERFDGDEDDTPTMRGSLGSLPFLTERKLVVLHQPGKQKAFAEEIETVLGEVADTTDLLIVEPKLDKRFVYYKTLKKDTDFREFNEMDANGLVSWAAEYVKEQGGSLSPADGRLLVERIGPSQQLLSSELDKLLVYDAQITKATIELLTEPTPQSTVFQLLDAAFAGHTKRALELYQEQRALKVEPQAIIAMLAWQLHVLALVKTAGDRSVDDIAREARLNPFVVRKSQGLVGNISLTKMKEMISQLLSLDIRLKTAMIDADEALGAYLIRLKAGE